MCFLFHSVWTSNTILIDCCPCGRLALSFLSITPKTNDLIFLQILILQIRPNSYSFLHHVFEWVSFWLHFCVKFFICYSRVTSVNNGPCILLQKLVIFTYHVLHHVVTLVYWFVVHWVTLHILPMLSMWLAKGAIYYCVPLSLVIQTYLKELLSHTLDLY